MSAIFRRASTRESTVEQLLCGTLLYGSGMMRENGIVTKAWRVS
jgi:hypothetical protein